MLEIEKVVEAEIVEAGEQALALRTQPAADLVLPSPLPADRHPVAAYLGQLTAESSKVTQEYAIKRAASILAPGVGIYSIAWHTLEANHLARLKTKLIQDSYSPASINSILTAVRGVCKWAWVLGQMTHEQYEKMKIVKLAKVDEGDVGRRVGRDEFIALFRACADGTIGGYRDAAIVATLYGVGTRRAEAASINFENFVRFEGKWRLQIVRGKGGKSRTVFPPTGMMLAIDEWLVHRGREPGPLFPALDRRRCLTTLRLSGGAIYRILGRRVRAAGLTALSPHDCRRTLASNLLDAGKDLNVVAEILGHAKLETTRRYDRRGEKAQQSAMADVDVPFTAEGKTK